MGGSFDEMDLDITVRCFTGLVFAKWGRVESEVQCWERDKVTWDRS